MTGNSEISNTPSTSVSDVTISPIRFLKGRLGVGEWTADNNTGVVTLKIGNNPNGTSNTNTLAKSFQSLLLKERIGYTPLRNESAGYDTMSFSPETVGALRDAIEENKITMSGIMSGILNDLTNTQGPSR